MVNFTITWTLSKSANPPLSNQNQNQINGMNALMAFPGYEARMGFRINGIHALGHEPGYECLMAFTVPALIRGVEEFRDIVMSTYLYNPP